MPLISAVCPQCKAKIQIESEKDAGLCPQCHTPFVTKKARMCFHDAVINNPNGEEGKEIENLLRAGDAYLKLEDFSSAKTAFMKLTEEAPFDYRGWLGVILTETKLLTVREESDESLERLAEWYRRAKAVASPEETAVLEEQAGAFMRETEELLKKREKAKKAYQDKLAALTEQYHGKADPCQTELDGLVDERQELHAEGAPSTPLRAATVPVCTAGAIIGILFGFFAGGGLMKILIWAAASVVGFALLAFILLFFVCPKIDKDYYSRRGEIHKRMSALRQTLATSLEEYEEAKKQAEQEYLQNR